jgi:hypothetical protein
VAPPPLVAAFQCKTIGENNAFVSLSKQWYEHGLYVGTAFVDFVAGLQIAVHALVGDVAEVDILATAKCFVLTLSIVAKCGGIG